MSAPKDLQSLVDAFASVDRKALNETQIREQFINHLFTALGWNITDPNGSPDVVLEDQVMVKQSAHRSQALKAPDYGFYIGSHRPADRKFFVEAKRPSINLSNSKASAYQLRCYAWSAALPFSILTNFEEFVVYDCATEPNPDDSADTAVEFRCHYTEYADKWPVISALFSKEAVCAGSLDLRFRKPKRGQVTVDAAFLRDIARWRLILAEDARSANPGITAEQLNYVVQMTIDRIIFLRIAEDRNIEDYETLKRACEKKNIWRALLDLFYAADRKYNSGLFHFRKSDKEHPGQPDRFTPSITFGDKALKSVILGMYWPRPYAFIYIPAYILGAVYEQFLGDVLTIKNGKCTVEPKPEVRKAGGIYYTPEFVAQYIISETVAPQIGRSLAKAKSIRILDPACGSGSFLITAYQYLLDWHLNYYVTHNPEGRASGKDAVLYKNRNGSWSLKISERKRILLSSIFGVDTDPHAVEVAKLSLLLKLLENETDEVRQKKLFAERVLPDLGRNILCGNSLIENDYWDDDFELLQDSALAPFDWDARFSDVMPRGFDAVIGNPPYVRIQRIEEHEANYYFRKYTTPASKMDLSLVFLERALRKLVCPTGVVGFICTGQWMYAEYGKKLREMLSEGHLREIVDFGSLPVFADAQTYPAIFLLTRKKSKAVQVKRIRDEALLTADGIENAVGKQIPISEFDSDPWLLGGFNLPKHLREVGLPHVTLSEIGKAYIGTKTGKNEVFVLSRSQALALDLESQLLVPYAKVGADVAPFGAVQEDNVVIYPYKKQEDGSSKLMDESELAATCPKIYKWLLEHKCELRKRKDSRRLYADGADWYRLLRPGSIDVIEAPKLVVKGVEKRPFVGMLASNVAFDGARCPCIIIDDYRGHSFFYFLGVLNSKVVAAYLNRVCPPKLNGYVEFSAGGLGRAPLRLLDLSVRKERKMHDNISQLAAAIADLVAQHVAAQVSTVQTRLFMKIKEARARLESMVAEVYGLSADQITRVEREVGECVW